MMMQTNVPMNPSTAIASECVAFQMICPTNRATTIMAKSRINPPTKDNRARMTTQNDINDDIAARLGAIEFMLRQLFIAYVRSSEGNPEETVAMLQASTAAILRETQSSISDANDRARFAQQSVHIARIHEDILRGLEE